MLLATSLLASFLQLQPSPNNEAGICLTRVSDAVTQVRTQSLKKLFQFASEVVLIT